MMPASAMVKAYAQRPTFDMFNYQRGPHCTTYEMVSMEQQVKDLKRRFTEEVDPTSLDRDQLEWLQRDLGTVRLGMDTFQVNVSDRLTSFLRRGVEGAAGCHRAESN